MITIPLRHAWQRSPGGDYHTTPTNVADPDTFSLLIDLSAPCDGEEFNILEGYTREELRRRNDHCP